MFDPKTMFEKSVFSYVIYTKAECGLGKTFTQIGYFMAKQLFSK